MNKDIAISLVAALRPFIECLRTTDSAIKDKNGPAWTSEPLTDERVLEHLNGGPVRGACSLDWGSNMTRTATLDLDSHKGEVSWPDMVEVAKPLIAKMREYGLCPTSFRSSGGNGIHIHCIWPGVPQKAWLVRVLMRKILGEVGFKEGAGGVIKKQIEVFPKQDQMAPMKITVGKDGRKHVNRGSQTWLPLGGKSLPLEPITLELLPKKPESIIWEPSASLVEAALGFDTQPTKKKKSNTKVDFKYIIPALAAINNDGDGVDYEDWFKIVAAIHYESGGGAEGMELAQQFSARSDKYDQNTFDYKWDSISDDCDDPANAKTIFALAKKFGWSQDDAHQPQIDEFNKKHFIVRAGGKTVVACLVPDLVIKQERLDLSSCYDTARFYANMPPILNVGQRPSPFFDYWMSHPKRRTYDGLVFEPEDDVPGNFYNLWCGFAVEPCVGDCSLYLTMIHDVICFGNDELYEWVIAWMAQAIQHPGQRPGTAIALRGGMGTGKGTVATYFGKLFGRHFTHITSSKHLVGNFNSHTMESLILFADEAVWAGDHTNEGAIKAMVTEDWRIIEGKFKDAFQLRNHIRLLLASNKDWIVPAGLDERRFCVIDVSELHKQDLDYFGAIRKQMNNGGCEALMYHLLNLDISGVNLRQIPMSTALDEQKASSLSPLHDWWISKLHNGSINGVKTNSAGDWCVFPQSLYIEFIEMTRKRGLTHLPGLESFSMSMRKMMPGLKRERATLGNKRRWCWMLPSLAECKSKFPTVIFDGDSSDDWDWTPLNNFDFDGEL
jgi:hypothetical protein